MHHLCCAVLTCCMETTICQCLSFGSGGCLKSPACFCCLLVPAAACWCLLVPAAACWCLLVPAPHARAPCSVGRILWTARTAAGPVLLACAPVGSAQQQQYHAKRAPKQQQHAGQGRETPRSTNRRDAVSGTNCRNCHALWCVVLPLLHAASGGCFPGTICLWHGAARRQLLHTAGLQERKLCCGTRVPVQCRVLCTWPPLVAAAP